MLIVLKIIVVSLTRNLLNKSNHVPKKSLPIPNPCFYFEL